MRVGIMRLGDSRRCAGARAGGDSRTASLTNAMMHRRCFARLLVRLDPALAFCQTANSI